MRPVALGLAVAGLLLSAAPASATFPPFRTYPSYSRPYIPPYGRGGYLPSPYPYYPPYRPIYPPYIPPVRPLPVPYIPPVTPVVPVNPIYPPYIPPYYPPYGPFDGGSAGATRVPPPVRPVVGGSRVPPPRPGAGLPAGLGFTAPPR
jgi:hypothetical protein